MTQAELLDQIYSRIGNERDSGIPAPLILKIAETALEAVCRRIAFEKPLNNELLLGNSDQAAGALITVMGESALLLSGFTFGSTGILILQNPLHNVTVTNPSGITRVRPVNSLDSLRSGTDAGIPCYFIKPPHILFKLPAALTGITTYSVVAYKIPSSITNYPTQLREHLVAEILQLLLPSLQEKRNEKPEQP